MSRWSERQVAMLASMGVRLPASRQVLDVSLAATASPSVDEAQFGTAPAPVQRRSGGGAEAPPPQPSSAQPPSAALDLKLGANVGTGFADLGQLAEAVRNCRACGLCETRRQAVPGEGHAQAQWMVVGEAPGEQEDREGRPFVGASGQLLDAMLAALGLGRAPAAAASQVYIANSIKCRPPGNRNPSAEELAACAPFLQAQLRLVRPRVVLALGRYAVKALLGSDEPIGRLRGRAHRLADGTPVVVSYHPAYLLRQPAEKARAWEDLCLAADLASKLASDLGSDLASASVNGPTVGTDGARPP